MLTALSLSLTHVCTLYDIDALILAWKGMVGCPVKSGIIWYGFSVKLDRRSHRLVRANSAPTWLLDCFACCLAALIVRTSRSGHLPVTATETAPATGPVRQRQCLSARLSLQQGQTTITTLGLQGSTPLQLWVSTSKVVALTTRASCSCFMTAASLAVAGKVVLRGALDDR